jgi:hypothetical protein
MVLKLRDEWEHNHVTHQYKIIKVSKKSVTLRDMTTGCSKSLERSVCELHLSQCTLMKRAGVVVTSSDDKDKKHFPTPEDDVLRHLPMIINQLING